MKGRIFKSILRALIVAVSHAAIVIVLLSAMRFIQAELSGLYYHYGDFVVVIVRAFFWSMATVSLAISYELYSSQDKKYSVLIQHGMLSGLICSALWGLSYWIPRILF